MDKSSGTASGGGGGSAPRARRPYSISLPSAAELQLPLHLQRVQTGLLPLLGEVASPRSPAGDGSPAAFSGSDSPVFYSAPLPQESPRPAQAPLSVSFVAGGLLQSMSAGRLPIAPPAVEAGAAAKADAGALMVRDAAPEPAAAAPAWEEWGWFILEYLIRFTVHIVLLALFESIFFWSFVSVSEDDALQKLVDGYVGSTLDSCPSWNASQRFIVTALTDLLINVTTVDAQGAAAQVARDAYNAVLFRNSWLYFGGLGGLLAALCAIAVLKRRKMPWGHIVAENLVLILMLGLYELAFFKTIVLKYQAVSGAELVRCGREGKLGHYCSSTTCSPTSHTSRRPQDRKIIHQFIQSCTNSSLF